MDKIARYRTIIKGIAQDYLDYIPPLEDIETVFICDEAKDHYIMMYIGWRHPRRIHSMLFHLRIAPDGVIWIEEDRTQEGIVVELMNAGVPAQDIEMGYQPPEMRPYLEYKHWKYVAS